MIFVGLIVGSGGFSGFFTSPTGLQRPLTGAGRRQHWQFDGDGGGNVFDAAGADRQGAQAMLAAHAHQPGQVDGAFAGRQFVQGQHQRRVAEEVRRLGDLGGQLAVKASRSLRASSSTVMASMLPFSWNTGSWSSGSVWLMVGIKRLVTKSAETYNENARGRKPSRTDVECAALVFPESLMDRPRFRAISSSALLAAVAGPGPVVAGVQLPYPALLTIGRLLGRHVPGGRRPPPHCRAQPGAVLPGKIRRAQAPAQGKLRLHRHRLL
jgi:hypothetical protein